MDKYVILGQLHGVGGWQTYINNKLCGIRKYGWETYAIGTYCVNKKNFTYLPELSNYKDFQFLELSFCPGALNKRRRLSFAKKIRDIISFQKEDNVIFEATTEILLLWAEFLSEYFHGKSICVNVKNRFPKYSSSFQQYFDFKIMRGEFLMMINNGFRDLQNGYKQYSVSNDHVVSPLTYDMFYDDGIDYKNRLQIHNYDAVIGTIGWLDKAYYKVLDDEVISFAKKHSNQHYLFVVIGSSSNGGIEKKYQRAFSSIDNVHLQLMGSMTPIPSNLIRTFDVCVASYGCAIISDRLRIKTIMMHDTDNIPLGIMGYTLRVWPYVLNRANKNESINRLIEEVLIDKICDKIDYSETDYGIDGEKEIELHIRYLEQSSQDKSYYDISKLIVSSRKLVLLSTLLNIFGTKFVTMMLQFKDKGFE